MEDQELQQWIEQISMASFGRPFVHQARFNRRLRSTGGRYFMKSHDIEISWNQWETFGRDEIEKIIKHELCHYHLHIMKRGYKHRDHDFKTLLAQVGGSRYCQSLPKPRAKQAYKYRLECVKCRTAYLRKRKMDVSKYACGNCRGKLKLVTLDLTSPS
ncbi:SprT family protein [Paenibacillus roseipurpureus]|uniref:SprT family protein n=1 Tax=Paenibacillus roseopurpureus TaxID=2918901 RepID=A0AA96LL32_9BACL|nr:SprT family protein [Paenibacillus sp. MBLB1832]WNR43862.1 SprT family protein [Paenibacillus sp. MBLB1832]